MEENRKAWNSKLRFALWADRVTVKMETGCAPFDIVYGIQDRLSHNRLMQIYKFVQVYDEDLDDEMRMRINDLMQLDETRREEHSINEKLKLQVKDLYDIKTAIKKFEVDGMVLMWNDRSKEKGKHKNFDPIWLGPYIFDIKWGEDSYLLRDITKDTLKLLVHGQFLKHYFS